MNNDTPTDRATLWDEAVDLISSTTVLGALYAFSIILYYLSTRLFYSQSRDIDGKFSRRTLFTFALASVMIVCATIDIITLNLYTKTVYLDIRTLPIGPDRTLAENQAFAIGKANLVVTFVEMTLSLGVLSWRVWTVWSGTWLVKPVAIFSSLLYLATTGTYNSYIIIITWSIPYFSSSTPSLFERVLSESVAFIAASTIFMTLMIVSRLMVVVRWKHIKIMGKTESAAQYLGITAMLVESFALGAVWILALLICPLLESAIEAYNFFNASAVQIQVLTDFLIIYRVFSGRTRNGQTQSRLSTLQWGQGATQPADTTIRPISIGVVNERDNNPEGNIHV